MNKILEILLPVVLALACAVLGTALQRRKQWILAQLAALIQRTETAIQGSGLGAEKKRLVLAQLEAMGIKATAWISDAIDAIVTTLNERRAWLTENAGDGVGDSK